MELAIKVLVGATAAAAALTMLANYIVDNSSLKWEGTIKFYDYIEGKIKSIKDVLDKDNGRIVETKIQYKDISGSVDMALALVLKTDKNEYWSIEKNEICIHVQRSFKEYDVKVMLNGKIRNTTLVYSNSKQLVYLNKWGISESCVRGVASKQVHVNDVLSYLDEEETLITFSYLENSQDFLQRLLKFICIKTPSYTPFYDYCTEEYLYSDKVLEGIPLNLSISELMLMYKVTSSQQGIRGEIGVLVGFFIRTNNGCCWGFEEGVDRLFIQKSDNREAIIRMVNGKNRERFLRIINERFNADQSEVIFKTLSSISNKNINFRSILALFEKIKMTKNSDQDFVDAALKLMYYYPETITTFFTFFDYTKCKFADMFTFIIRSVDRLDITKVWLMSKVGYNGEGGIKRDYGLVILMETNENNYWSVERIENSIHVQRSNNDVVIYAKLNGEQRCDKLEPFKMKTSENRKAANLYDFLEFVMDYQRGLTLYPPQHFIDSALKQLGYIL